MSKRNTEERRDAIIAWVNSHGLSHVDELARRFSTSTVTIRKDLSALAERQLLIRQHGGAAPLPAAAQTTKVTPPLTPANSVKAALGNLAASLIQDHQKIIIDSGSTLAAVIPHLANYNGLVVMTNSLQVANQVITYDNEPTLLMTGGTWDPQSQSFQGQMAGQVVQSYSFDVAFVGAAGIDIHRGTTTYNELTQLSQEMAKVATKVVVVAESSKLKHKMPNLELPWQNINVLVTDSGLAADAVEQIKQQGVDVMMTPLHGE
jgi:DeoR/GlpR family transcriptional regulator of sugar metabolism